MVKCNFSNKLELFDLPDDWVEWLSALSTFNLREEGEVKLYEITANSIKIPRGLLNTIHPYFQKHGSLEVCNNNYLGKEISLNIDPKFNYTSGDYGYQDTAVNALISYKTARLEGPTGCGKTMMACIAMSKLNTGPSLFLTMKDNLLRQFQQEVFEAFGLEDVGLIKGSKMDIKPITVGSLPTMGSKTFMKSKMHLLKDQFANVFFDECHRSKAITYREVIMNLNPDRLYGISATPDESLDKEILRMMEALLGPIVYRVLEEDIPNRIIPETYIRKTGCHYFIDGGLEDHYERSKLQKEVKRDSDRNELAANDIKLLLNQDPNNQVLVCLSLTDHAADLYKILTDEGVNCSFPYKKVKDYSAMKKYKIPVLDNNGVQLLDDKGKPVYQKDNKGKIKYTKNKWKWKLDDKMLEEAVIELEKGKKRVLLGTYNAFTEGFNCKSLNTVLFFTPVSGKNNTRTYQVIGRCCRKFKGKEKVFALYYSDESSNSDVFKKWAEGFKSYCIKRWGFCNIIQPPS